MPQLVRWLLVVPVAIAAWYLVFVAGIFAHGFLEEVLCPPDEMISGMCTNPRVRVVLTVLVHAFAGFSAVAVELAVVGMAPSSREATTWIAFAVGAVVAVAFGFAAQTYGEAATAVIAGVIAAVIITRHLARSASRALAPP
jgi:hypothetical protein